MYKRTAKALLGAVLMIPSLLLADGSWFYSIGEPMPARQVNICDTRAEVDRLARVFHEKGPRPGYAALSQSDHCRIAIVGFTPVDKVMSVPVEEGGVLMYTVHFLEVEPEGGGSRRFVVTTRSVK